MAICYGYGRHSTRHQELTETVQESKVVAFYERDLKPKGVEWGGFHYDLAISGSKPFSERTHGLNICSMTVPGDYIVSSRLDRAFRNTLDGLRNIEAFKTKQVTFYSLDLPTVFSDPLYGKLLLTVMLAFSELDRGITRDRILDVIEYRKKEGLPYSAATPMGWKKQGTRPNQIYVVNPKERLFIESVVAKRPMMTVTLLARWARVQTDFQLDRPFDNNSAITWACHAHTLGFPKVCSFKRIRAMIRDEMHNNGCSMAELVPLPATY